MKINEYIKKIQVESGKDALSFSQLHGISQSQFYRYTDESYMSKITPLIASKVCKAFNILPFELYSFDNGFSDDFIDKVETYLSSSDNVSRFELYSKSSIDKFYINYLSNYGFYNIIFEPHIEIIGRQYCIINKNKNLKIPFIQNETFFPNALIKNKNGKEYIVFFLSPKHLTEKTSIYSHIFQQVHSHILFAVSQISDSLHKYDNNFLFLTTSDFIFDSVTDSNNYISGFITNKGTDIYMGLCRTNRQYKCKKITNPKEPDKIFIK